MNRGILIIILIFILIIVYYIYKIYKNFKIVEYALVNNLQCGKPKCDISIKNIPVLPPPNNLGVVNEFHKSLINYMELSGMKLVKQIDTSQDKLMAVLATINSSPETLIIAIRGTQTIQDLSQDTHIAQTPFQGNALVHQGFFNVYNDVKDDILSNIPNNIQNIIVVGHSLGSAVAVLIGLILKKSHPLINTRVITYACPRIGNKELVDMIDSNVEHIRIVNNSDAVPNLPSAVSPNKLNPPIPWLYYHSGTPITFNLNWQSVLNNHLIPVYMEFINNS